MEKQTSLMNTRIYIFEYLTGILHYKKMAHIPSIKLTKKQALLPSNHATIQWDDAQATLQWDIPPAMGRRNHACSLCEGEDSLLYLHLFLKKYLYHDVYMKPSGYQSYSKRGKIWGGWV